VIKNKDRKMNCSSSVFGNDHQALANRVVQTLTCSGQAILSVYQKIDVFPMMSSVNVNCACTNPAALAVITGASVVGLAYCSGFLQTKTKKRPLEGSSCGEASFKKSKVCLSLETISLSDEENQTDGSSVACEDDPPEVVKEPQSEVVKKPQPEVVEEPQPEVAEEPQPEADEEPQPEVVEEPQPEADEETLPPRPAQAILVDEIEVEYIDSHKPGEVEVIDFTDE